MNYKKIFFVLTILIINCIQGISQETSEIAKPCIWKQIELTDKILIFISIILLIPIYYLSKVFTWSLKDYLNKYLNNKSLIVLAMILPSLLIAQGNNGQTSSYFDSVNFLRWFLFFIIFIELIILVFYGKIFYNFFKNHHETTQNLYIEKDFWLKRWWVKVNNFGSKEDEQKIDLGHNYDGIRELDNNIPAWFTASFVICFLFGVIYVWNYHFARISPLQAEEFEIEMQDAEIAHQKYLKTAGSQVDENALKFELIQTELDDAKKLFLANCASCHLVDGGGLQGPNLTDKNWIYGCSPTDVYQTIKYGRKNGMMAWKDNFNDKQIQSLMNYVHSLNNNKVANPKASQGEICQYIDTSGFGTTLDTIKAK